MTGRKSRSPPGAVLRAGFPLFWLVCPDPAGTWTVKGAPAFILPFTVRGTAGITKAARISNDQLSERKEVYIWN